MNTYEFQLRLHNILRPVTIRAANLEAAVEQIEDEINEGWSIESVSENGTPLPTR